MDKNLKSPQISVAIPFYNSAQFLREAVESVLNQTYTDFELLLIDDGSRDNSIEIAKSYNDSRIIVYSDGQNKGLASRLNQSIELSRGKYYARMDADDVMHPRRLEMQIKLLQSNNKIDVLGSGYTNIDDKGRELNIAKVYETPSTIEDVLEHKCFCHPSIIGKIEWFKEHKYDEKMLRMEDLELWARTISKSTFRNIPTSLLYYRIVGVPTAKKYFQSNWGVIKYLLTTNNNIKIQSKLYYSLTYGIKILIYSLFSLFNQTEYLVKKR